MCLRVLTVTGALVIGLTVGVRVWKRGMGVRITGADKGEGSIQSGIKKVNEKPLCVTKKSVNVINELRGYVWAMDRTGAPTGSPVKRDDHAMDAGRYVYAEADKYSGSYSVGRK